MTAVSSDDPPTVVEAAASDDKSERVFSTSLAVSAVRCLLAYIVFPWLLPAFGLASGIAPGAGIAIGLVAIGFNVYSIRRFQRSEHQWRKYVIALNFAVIVLLVVLLVIDIAGLF